MMKDCRLAEIGIEFAKNCFLLIMLFMATGGHAATEAQIKRVKSKGFYLKVYSGEGWIKGFAKEGPPRFWNRYSFTAIGVGRCHD